VAKCSLLAELVNISRVNRINSLKLVMLETSSECIKAFEEEEEQKRVAEEKNRKES